MANKSKNKGKAFEREICTFLTELFGVNFQRIPNSGAHVGGLNAHRYASLTPEQRLLADGDIIVPKELENFSIECKSYKDFAFHGLLDEGVPILDKWIDQASHTNKKFWLLIYKINSKGWYVAYDPFKLAGAQISVPFSQYKEGVVITEAKCFFNDNKDFLLKIGSSIEEQKQVVPQ